MKMVKKKNEKKVYFVCILLVKFYNARFILGCVPYAQGMTFVVFGYDLCWC